MIDRKYQCESMAHDDRIAVAAVWLRRDLDAVGIDI
jgi:hypothetical protein